MKTRTISQCLTKCYCSYVTNAVVVKTEWKKQKWIHIKSISMHAVHTLYTYINVRMRWENAFHIRTAQSEGTSQSCDIIVSMQHAHLNECSTIEWCVCGGGMQWQTYFLSATYMLLIWSYTAWIFFFFNLRGGKCPCCPLAGFTA